MTLRLIGWCAIALLACGGDDDAQGESPDAAPSGRACASGQEVDDPTVLVSPALDCPSQLCLHVESAPPDLCTAFCEDAGDCIDTVATACDGEFVCVEPMDQGPFACRKTCVCASAVPEGGFSTACPDGALRR